LRELPLIDEMVTLAKRIMTDYKTFLKQIPFGLVLTKLCFITYINWRVKIIVFTDNIFCSAIATVLFHMTGEVCQ